MIRLAFCAILCAFLCQLLFGELEVWSLWVGKVSLFMNDEINRDNLQFHRQSIQIANQDNFGAIKYDVQSYVDLIVNGSSTDSKNFASVALRIYLPFNSSGISKPVLIWFHGGGFVFGSLAASHKFCMQLTNLTEFVVISVHYRLAPEFPFPHAFEDAKALFGWLQQQGLQSSYGGDLSRVFVGGEDSGATIAVAVTAHLARMKKKSNFRQIGLLIVYPLLSHGVHFDSYSRYARVNGLLTRDQLQQYWSMYLGNASASCSNSYACPLLTPSKSLQLFPTTILVLAKHDVVLDEGLQFLDNLQQVAVTTHLSLYNSTVHGFFSSQSFGPGVSAVAEVVSKLKFIARS